MWSLCGWVMKMTPISVNFMPAFASRRRVPSPASIRYIVPLTINKFDDCAWCATGTGPTRVPSVMRRVPDCVGEALDVCAPASCACQNTAAQTNAILQSVEMDLRGLTLLSRGLGITSKRYREYHGCFERNRQVLGSQTASTTPRVIQMSELGHLRPGLASRRSGHVRYAPKAEVNSQH